MSEANKNLVRRHLPDGELRDFRGFEEIWNRRDLSVCEEIMAVDDSENAAAPFAMSGPGKVNGPAATRGTVVIQPPGNPLTDQ